MENKSHYSRFLLLAFSFINEGFTSVFDKKKKIKYNDFPIPHPAGGTVITDRRNGAIGHWTLRYDGKRHASLRSFYDSYTSESNWERIESGKGAVLSIIYSNRHKGYTINLAAPDSKIMNAVLVTFFVAAY